MDNASSTSAALISAVPAAQSDISAPAHPDKIDGRLLWIGAVCGLASMMGNLDGTAVAVAQRTFATEFGSTQAIVSWTMAGYMLAFAAVVPVTGWAADRFGAKRVFMGGVLVFTLASLLCTIAPNIVQLIGFRALQGIGSGIMTPLCFVILTRESGPKRLGRLVAIGAAPFLLGPLGGPILGGWLIGTCGWEWIFLINLPIGLSALAVAAVMLPKDRSAPSETLDVTGMLLLSPGMAALLGGMSSLPGRRTLADPHVLLPSIAGLTLIAAFVFHAWRRVDAPLIDLRLLKNRVVRQANLTLLIFAVTYVGISLLVPSYFQVVLHQTPMQAGMHLIAMGLGVVLTTPVAGIVMDRHGPGGIVLAGFPLIAAGLAIFTIGVARHADYAPTLMAGLLLMGMGMGCVATPLSAACVQQLAPHQIARGATLRSVNNQLGGAVGAALMTVLLTNQLIREDTSTASGHLVHAYTQVFAIAAAVAAIAIVAAAFLPATADDAARRGQPDERPSARPMRKCVA
ncbi:DHA2 family efflux MFS transporter permease subunit [Mycobacterium intracellulare]|uniref:DHA2 family efflux MFS transporter permease subunit n=1 Tax=Mycobacterium intracellulare subsp. chimaera TaxID=222805 RepID=A0A1Y0TD14_MYCIT|nr:DHA2 family efflux MFS transporter permease subunit [Mycobacterium intracellulare]ARV83759.1 MFS transporter [Mycobacterium intracellulare subsp. chimaera]ASL11007.1 EmrB efflux protein [Mycobacterium intracellulare subsp. chimaera]ASL16900.1 EmrB efflux protein [Mycobacterium intracellulare subsp. chimaera]ASL22949.1 EmrB efflux protein [Mycobacterium intracellulare subsp. chimaera]ASQ87893.1 MFS transporter [Mycobacterium intracellulare subsp. chimaera]